MDWLKRFGARLGETWQGVRTSFRTFNDARPERRAQRRLSFQAAISRLGGGQSVNSFLSSQRQFRLKLQDKRAERQRAKGWKWTHFFSGLTSMIATRRETLTEGTVKVAAAKADARTQTQEARANKWERFFSARARFSERLQAALGERAKRQAEANAKRTETRQQDRLFKDRRRKRLRKERSDRWTTRRKAVGVQLKRPFAWAAKLPERVSETNFAIGSIMVVTTGFAVLTIVMLTLGKSWIWPNYIWPNSAFLALTFLYLSRRQKKDPRTALRKAFVNPLTVVWVMCWLGFLLGKLV